MSMSAQDIGTFNPSCEHIGRSRLMNEDYFLYPVTCIPRESVIRAAVKIIVQSGNPDRSAPNFHIRKLVHEKLNIMIGVKTIQLFLGVSHQIFPVPEGREAMMPGDINRIQPLSQGRKVFFVTNAVTGDNEYVRIDPFQDSGGSSVDPAGLFPEVKIRDLCNDDISRAVIES